MLRDPVEAEDLTQDVFVQIYKKLHTFQGTSALSTWVYRVTVNQVLMYMRRNKKRKLPVVDADDEMYSIPAPVVNPDVVLLSQSLSQMPQGYRDHIVLHDYLGYEHREVAAMLGVTEGTAKSQLHKARTKMKKVINKKCNPRVISR
jgi:RNA polymerase sigma-70 factor (ECF subfamily)